MVMFEQNLLDNFFKDLIENVSFIWWNSCDSVHPLEPVCFLKLEM